MEAWVETVDYYHPTTDKKIHMFGSWYFGLNKSLLENKSVESELSNQFAFTEQCFNKFIEIQDSKTATFLRQVMRSYHILYE